MSRISPFLKMTFAGILLIAMTSTLTAQAPLGRIYAKVTTRGGDVLEGRVSWGEHETIWHHLFNAEYDFYDHNRDAYYRQRELHGKRPRKLTAQFNVFFGQIVSIVPRGKRGIVILKDDKEYEVSSGDVGESLYINDKELGHVKVTWSDMENIEFLAEPVSYARYADENAYPIFGKVLTHSGHTFKGFLMWDNDESLSSDVIDGKEGRYERKIPFSRIKSIKPRTRRSSEIVLVTGKKIVLSGSNDVNDDNKGIFIVDPDYEVQIEWRDVVRVDFEHNVPAMRYTDFKKGKYLYGTLIDDYGKEHTGFIRWDDDERTTNDFLDGESYGYTMRILFRNIKEIRRRTRKSALVFLKNGIELRMSEGNDVNSSNKGIVILKKFDDEEGELFTWDEFEKVIFKQ